MLERVWRRGKLPYIVGGSGNWYSHYGDQYGSSLKKKKKRTTGWSCNPTAEQISRENHSLKGYTHPSVYNSTVYNSWDVEATLKSIDRELDKEDVMHIHNGILLSHKKEWTNAICGTIDGTRNCHTKSQKDRYDTAYMQNLKLWYKWTYLQNRNRFTDLGNERIVTK